MGFVPIPGIRVDSLLTPRRTEGIAQSRFVVKSSERTDDESYSSSQQESEQGLAEEESAPVETLVAPTEVDATEPDPLQGTQVNCIV